MIGGTGHQEETLPMSLLPLPLVEKKDGNKREELTVAVSRAYGGTVPVVYAPASLSATFLFSDRTALDT
ncbi:hypothetical protein ASD99_21470 [Mesorhizobium sp. Root695]|nr:hypothetical protein ASD99_21470 [Mesorhizobium sp. Root695]